jgi:Peptidase C13 family
MVSVRSVLKLAARAAVWRTTPDPPLVGLPSLLGWAVTLAVMRVALQFAGTAGGPSHFNPYGLNAVVAWLAFQLSIAAFFVRPAAQPTALAAMFILSIIADIVAALVQFGGPLLPTNAVLDAWFSHAPVAAAVFTIEIVWWVGAMTCVLGSVQPNSRLRLLARAVALWIALFAAHTLLPDAPVFVRPDFDIRSANWWEYLYARYGAQEVAQLEKEQSDLLKTEVDALTPQRKGTTDIYVIGLAGWADQEVFVKELDGALTSLGAVLPIKDHTLRLVNNRETASSVPLATPKSFSAAVHAVGGIMDKDEDVLLVVMTSHGNQRGFSLQLPGNLSTDLTPQQVATALDSEGIKNRVVIVSACFAGIFTAPLRNDNTIVMTASDDKSTSFGCAPERDWTYFGDALFHQSLQPGTDFEQAFDHARVLIHGWELMDRAPPSNPQGSFGPALVAKLAPVFRAGPNPQ